MSASTAPTIPTTQTVAEYTAKGSELSVRTNVPVQEIGKYDVLVRVEACGICQGEKVARFMASSYPRIPGHEVVGTVVKVGPEAKRWKVGDRVGRGWHGGHCFECEQCRRGDFTMCAAHSGCGSSVDGGYQEYMVAPWESLAAVPEGMSPIDAAPLLCAGLTVFNSLRHQNVKPGRLVGVQGVGGLGHYAIQFAVKMGYEVVAITSPDKVEWAKKLGAKHVVDTSKFPADSKVEKNAASELKKLGGCSVIMCTGMGADQMSALIGGLAIGGVLLTLGVDMQKPLQVPIMSLVLSRGSVAGWPSGDAQAAEETMQFAAKFGVKSYVETFPLEDAVAGYKHMEDGKVRFRVALVTKEGAKYKPDSTATAASKK